MRMLVSAALSAVLLAAPLAPAFAQDEDAVAGAADPARQKAMKELALALADDVALPGYAAFADAAHGLEAATGELCTAPSEAKLDAARARFQDAADAWMRVQPLRFGPGEFLMRGFRVSYWPDTRNVVTKQLAALVAEGDEAKLDPDDFARSSVAVQGLPALERLLFNDDALSADGGYRCKVAHAIAGNLVRVGEGTANEWRAPDGYRAGIETDPESVASEFFKAMYSGLEIVADQKLGAPMGSGFEKARAKRAENWRSGRALRNIALNIDGIAAVYRGGFVAALERAGHGDLAEDLDAQISALQLTLAELGPAISPVIETPEGYAKLEALKADVKVLRSRLAADMAPALDMVVGFNSLDGD